MKNNNEMIFDYYKMISIIRNPNKPNYASSELSRYDRLDCVLYRLKYIYDIDIEIFESIHDHKGMLTVTFKEKHYILSHSWDGYIINNKTYQIIVAVGMAWEDEGEISENVCFKNIE